MQEIIAIASAKNASTGRTDQRLSGGQEPALEQRPGHGRRQRHRTPPIEVAIVKLIKDNSLNGKTVPVCVQSFDPASLQHMCSIGLATQVVQLVDGNDVDHMAGAVICQTRDVHDFVDGRPDSWALPGGGRCVDAMSTPAGLADIKTCADAIGPWKPQLMSLTASRFKATNAEGSPHTGPRADVDTVAPATAGGGCPRGRSVLAHRHVPPREQVARRLLQGGPEYRVPGVVTGRCRRRRHRLRQHRFRSARGLSERDGPLADSVSLRRPPRAGARRRRRWPPSTRRSCSSPGTAGIAR